MKRRNFLGHLATGVGAATTGIVGATTIAACGGDENTPAGSSANSRAQKTRVQWRLTSSFPRSLDTLFGGAEVLAQMVEEMSDGLFKIRVYPAGELVPGLEVLDAVQQGTVQVGQTASYYYTGKNPALAFDCCVPFGMTARQQNAWLTEGGGLELMNQLFSDYNVITFPGGNTGVQMGGWFKREIAGLADLEGLKMRIPGLGGNVMSMLGVNVQVLAGGEIYPALERGAIDATEWVGPYDDEKLGFHQVAKYYYYPGWWEPGPSLSFYVNQKAWAALPADFKAIFRAACAASGNTMQARYDAKNPPALERILASGIQMRPFSTDIMEAAFKSSNELLEDNAAKDPGYRKIFEAWKKSRSAATEWFSTAESSYTQFVSTKK